jgi:hypothetical protein
MANSDMSFQVIDPSEGFSSEVTQGREEMMAQRQ